MANAPPIFFNQESLPDVQRYSDCGETAVSMIASSLGILVTPMQVIADLGTDGSTTPQQLTAVAQKLGLVVTPVSASTFPDSISNFPALVLIHDNYAADPSSSGPFEHWIDAYNLNNAGTVQCANPWGGRNIAYARGTLVGATIWAAIISRPYTPTPQPGELPVLMARNVDSLMRYELDGWGGVHPIGSNPSVHISGYWPGWNIARDIDVSPDGTIGVVLDGFGGLHPFAVDSTKIPSYPKGVAYWQGWDIATQVIVTDWSDPTNLKGYTRDGFGGLHPFGGALPVSGGCYFANNAA